MSGLRTGAQFVYKGRTFKYSLNATKSYQWAVLPMAADGSIANAPRPLWFKSRKMAESYAFLAKADWYNFGYAVARAYL